MTASGNKSVQLCTPKTKAAYIGLYPYLNGFVEACEKRIMQKYNHTDKGDVFR